MSKPQRNNREIHPDLKQMHAVECRKMCGETRRLLSEVHLVRRLADGLSQNML